MQKIQWLDDLSVGDEIVEVHHDEAILSLVTGVSKKSLFIDDRQYSKWDGTCVNESHWHVEPNIPETWEKAKEMKKRRLAHESQLKQERLAYVQSFPFEQLDRHDLRLFFKTYKIDQPEGITQVDILRSYPFHTVMEGVLKSMYEMLRSSEIVIQLKNGTYRI